MSLKTYPAIVKVQNHRQLVQVTMKQGEATWEAYLTPQEYKMQLLVREIEAFGVPRSKIDELLGAMVDVANQKEPK